MERVEPLVVNEFRALMVGYWEFKAKSESPSMTNEERYLCNLKLITIKGIILILKLLEESSARNKVLLALCLNGERCSKRYLIKEFKSLAALRTARNQFRFFLASTLFRNDKIIALLESNSLQEVEEVAEWYYSVFNCDELKRYYPKPLEKGNRYEAQTEHLS